jgi:hypothetical protein
VVRDKARRQYTDPAKVHESKHVGPFHSVAGPHLCEPSPQRTPVLVQAGVSPRGRDFAGRNAECLFINPLSPSCRPGTPPARCARNCSPTARTCPTSIRPGRSAGRHRADSTGRAPSGGPRYPAMTLRYARGPL